MWQISGKPGSQYGSNGCTLSLALVASAEACKVAGNLNHSGSMKSKPLNILNGLLVELILNLGSLFPYLVSLHP